MNCKCFRGSAHDNYTAIQLAACGEQGEATSIHLVPTVPVITLGSLEYIISFGSLNNPAERGRLFLPVFSSEKIIQAG